MKTVLLSELGGWVLVPTAQVLDKLQQLSVCFDEYLELKQLTLTHTDFS